MRLALVQLADTGVPGGNVEAACRRIDETVAAHAPDLIVLPEFFNTSYFFQYTELGRYWSLAESEDGPSLTAIKAKASEHGVAIIAPIYEEAAAGIRYDTAFFIGPAGDIVGRYRKTHGPGGREGRGYEKLYYRLGTQYPVFRVAGWNVGAIICYDWRFPEAARSLAVAGADLIVVPFATDRAPLWVEGLRTRAWENQVFLAACNRVGREDDWDFFGRSIALDPYGTVLATASDRGEDVVVVDIDRATIHQARYDGMNWRDRRPEVYGRVTENL